MSGVFNAIGKVFKPVINVVKKVALPALAIGAVVLTGGAALGALPSIASLGSSLGLSGALTGILSTAAQGATFGAVGSLLTGGDPLKGATTGLLVGGAAGGLSALTGVGAASGAAKAGEAAASKTVAPAAGADIPVASTAAAPVATTTAGAATAPALAAGAPVSGIGAVGHGIFDTVGNIGRGVLNFVNKNPIVAAGAIQGIGAGITASEQANAINRQRQQIMDNYTGVGGTLYGGGGVATPALTSPDAGAPLNTGKLAYDPQSGRVVVLGAGQ